MTLALALTASACGKKNTDSCAPAALVESAAGTGYQDKTSGYAGLAFTTVDSGYTSSAVMLNDPSSGQLTQLDTGESGDPSLAWLGDQLYLFNRTAASLNFSRLSLKDSPPTKTCQIATPAAGVGDPHDALLLSPSRLLLALNAAGALEVIDPTTGDLVQAVDAAWDLGGAPFHPEKFYQVKAADGTSTIYVLHQGLDAQYNPNGTQRLFVLKDDGSQLSVADPHGIALKVTNPLGFYASGNTGTVLIYGECTALAKGACTQGFEELTLATNTTALTLDTGALGFKGNGGLVKGSGTAYYELASKDGKNLVEKIDLAAKTATDVYDFTGPSGCCALYFDDTAGTLYIGDSDAKATAGFFAVVKDGAAKPTQVALPGLAYGGVFVPK